jgi:hypothetical protein
MPIISHTMRWSFSALTDIAQHLPQIVEEESQFAAGMRESHSIWVPDFRHWSGYAFSNPLTIAVLITIAVLRTKSS